MSTEFQEPEEKDLNENNNAEIIDDFNPLDEPVLEKEYTKHNVRIDPKDFSSDIPEPSFMPPPMNGTLKQDEKVKKEPEPFNPELKDLPKKDKQDASRRVAEMFMTGYEFANQMVDNALLFKERKILKMAQEGEIDLSLPIPIGSGQVITAGEYIKEYNEQSKGTIVVTQKFKDEVMPVLTNVLAKRGIGMSEENELLYLVAKDMIAKGFLAYQSLQIKKDFLNMWKEQTQAQRGGAMPSTPPTPPPPPPPTYQEAPTQPTYQQPTYNPDTNVNDFVNQMTGSIPPPQPIMEDDYEDDNINDYVEPEPKVKVLNTPKKGRKGRPKKK